MRFLPLLWSNLMRKKVRTLFTVLSIFVAFFLFGSLMAIQTAFGVGVELKGLDRLVMLNKVSLIQPLPISYQGRILADEGVDDVSHANWFGGIYQDPKNFFGQMAVDAESWLRVYPEIQLSEEEKRAWLADRTGAIVGVTTAERFGWEVGDRIPLLGTIFRKKDGSRTWEFTIQGIYDSDDPNYDKSQMFFHYEYLEEASFISGLVGWYVIQINDPEKTAVIAERIDERFANSPYETKTSTEKAFIQSFANQTGNIAAIVMGIVAVVFFTLLLVAGNTMAQSVRERTSELGVLKTLGFTDRQVMGLVLGESLFLAIVGGGAGLALIAWASRAFDLGGAMFPTFHVPTPAVALGAALILALGLVAGAIPAFQALRLKIVDALGRV